MSVSNHEITNILSNLHDKYTNNIEQSTLNRLYNIGILIINKNYDHNKLVQILTDMITKLSADEIKENERIKRIKLIDALKSGINDATAIEYKTTYNNYDFLVKRALRDRVLDDYASFY